MLSLLELNLQANVHKNISGTNWIYCICLVHEEVNDFLLSYFILTQTLIARCIYNVTVTMGTK